MDWQSLLEQALPIIIAVLSAIGGVIGSKKMTNNKLESLVCHKDEILALVEEMKQLRDEIKGVK